MRLLTATIIFVLIFIKPNNARKTVVQSEMRRLNGTAVNTFYNVIVQDGADPWVYKHTDGWYYLTRTTGNDVRIWRSRTFIAIDAGDSRIAWQPNDQGPACRSVWAPELHFLQSRWYIYFSATTCDGKNENHRMFVLENKESDPFTGNFNFLGQISDLTKKWAIDGTVLNHPSGSFYFIWSGWEGDVDGQQNLYIAQMSNPWTINSERVEIARPTYNWETNHWPHVNEGPEISIKNDVISLVYSASGSWTNDYCLGLVTTSIDNDPMNATSWKKHQDPIFASSNNVFAPGHHSFTKSLDDTEDWIVYHTARYSGSGWTRQVRTQKFTWNSDSTPNLGSPVNANLPIALPSGDQTRTRYEAENATLLNGPIAVPHPNASNFTKVGYIDGSESSVVFDVLCPIAGTYVIVIRNGNGSAGGVTAFHWLIVNNENPIAVPVACSGWDNWGSYSIRVNLLQGHNQLIFKRNSNYAEIDMLDVFPDE